jgi:hypothetical protein
MADAAAVEMQAMNLETEKQEVVAALAGAFGVAPPIDTGYVRWQGFYQSILSI